MRRMLALSASTVLFAAGLSAASPPQAGLHEGPTRTVYVTVLDKNDVPVTDLGPGDFVVKEGGKTRDVVDAGMANVPLRIALLIDDNGTGIFRYGVVKFIERLQGRAEFALSTVTGQNQKLVDYTADVNLLTAAIGQLTPDQREVISLRFFAGLSPREAGELMGRHEGTIRGLQFRAIAALRRQLGIEEPDAGIAGDEAPTHRRQAR